MNQQNVIFCVIFLCTWWLIKISYMSGILLVFYWHMTSVSFKSWVSYWVADVHLKSLCLESTASGRWHTWGSTWRWQWRLTHPTRPQLGPAKNGGKRRPSFTFWCAEKKCTRMNCLTHFGFHCTSNARICPSWCFHKQQQASECVQFLLCKLHIHSRCHTLHASRAFI